MEQAKHTPGPWKLDKRAGDEWWFGGRGGMEIVVEPAGDHLATVCVIGAQSSDGEPDANARLIAAAPELLAACQEFVRKCECGEAKSLARYVVLCERSYAQMKAAIAKATGSAS